MDGSLFNWVDGRILHNAFRHWFPIVNKKWNLLWNRTKGKFALLRLNCKGNIYWFYSQIPEKISIIQTCTAWDNWTIQKTNFSTICNASEKYRAFNRSLHCFRVHVSADKQLFILPRPGHRGRKKRLPRLDYFRVKTAIGIWLSIVEWCASLYLRYAGVSFLHFDLRFTA